MKTPTQTAHRAALLAHRESHRPAVLAPAPRSTLSPYALRCAMAAQEATREGFAGFAAALVAEAKTALPLSKIASASFHDHLEKQESNVASFRRRVNAAKTRADLAKLEASALRLYQSGAASAREFKAFDLMIFEALAKNTA